MSLLKKILECLPEESRIEKIKFVPRETNCLNELFQFPVAMNRKAISVSPEEIQSEESDLTLLVVPSSISLEMEKVTAIREWVEGDNHATEPISLMLSLQHVQILWSPNRIAIVAEAKRVETVQRAMIEASFYVSELMNIEFEISQRWPQLEEDIPIAFQYDQKLIGKKKELMQKFQSIYSFRAHLARITPFLLCPHVYPPTLASQVGERLRERMRVEDRVEFISDQLEVYEEVYELCSQRINDHQHAYKGHTLEWMIIILLLVQILLSVFDYLTIAGS
ncbi:hypothetical protein [Rubinisphaera italica]|uniref:DUF155 domain-containing protein n=1 Tax=Rubinisphaera italica TaxID=2527969 RepID=A0A5C5XDA5_9PLAN|nr:hypothetical protein [Rubinisphaera italica]TWT61076.1 hypothetical protein Pan54_18100 [Rubinisphaera italica]